MSEINKGDFLQTVEELTKGFRNYCLIKWDKDELSDPHVMWRDYADILQDMLEKLRETN